MWCSEEHDEHEQEQQKQGAAEQHVRGKSQEASLVQGTRQLSICSHGVLQCLHFNAERVGAALWKSMEQETGQLSVIQ